MDLLDKKKNYSLSRNSLFSKNSSLYWPGNLQSAVHFLKFICYFESIEYFFDCFGFSETLMNDLKGWKLKTVLRSALYFYFENKINERRKNNIDIISSYDWKLLSSLIINSKLSDNVLLFINKIGLIEISSEKIIVSGSFQAIKSIVVFEERISDTKGLKKLLKFLKVDSVSVDSLVDQAFQEKKIDKIAAFLYTFQSGLNDKLILTEFLINYKKYNSKQTQNEQKLQILSNDILELERSALESFSVFDLFDSGEESKSKVAELKFYSFYENLFDDITNNSEGGSLQLFKLFEQYLYSLKDNLVFRTNLSVDLLKKLVKNFCLVYKKEIDKIIKIETKFFKKLLKVNISLEATVLALILIALAIFQFAGIGPSRRQEVFLRSNNFAMITYQTPRWTSLDDKTATSQLVVTQPVSASYLSSTRPIQSSVFKPARPKLYATVLSQKQQPPLQIQANIQQKFSQSQVQQKVTEINKILAEKYPDCNFLVNFRCMTGDDNSLAQTNDLTLIGSNAIYKKGKNCKEFVAQIVKQSDGMLTFKNKTQLDQDHSIIKALLEGFNIRREEASTLFLSNVEHKAQTKGMNSSLPLNIGYTPETENAFDFLDILEDRYVKVIEDRYQIADKNSFADNLALNNLEPQDLIEGARRSYKTDRETLSNQNIAKDLILPLSHVRLANHQGAKEFDRLTTRFSQYHKPSMKKIATIIQIGIEDSFSRRQHLLAIKPYLVDGTVAARDAKRAENAFLHKVKEAIVYAEEMGAPIKSGLYQSFVDAGVIGKVSLEEAEKLLREDLEFDNLEDGVPMIFASNIVL